MHACRSLWDCSRSQESGGRRRNGRPNRLRISVNGGIQPSTSSFDSSTAPPVYLENSNVKTTYKGAQGPLFDGGVDFLMGGRFGVGVAVSWFSRKSDGAVDAAIPHPFFFHTPRTITGTASGLAAEFRHARPGGVVLRPAAKVDVALAAGPSFFNVTQDFVTDVSYTDTYPYDSPVFTAAISKQASSHKTGFNASADVGLRVSRSVGVGALVRFSKATMEFAVPNGSATTKSNAGGLQAAGGIRLYF
jgi:hypothetical protein